MKLTEAEWRLMRQVWRGSPVRARAVLDGLGDETGWAYTTVKTMLDRLVDKGVLAATLDGNVTMYRPLLSRAKAQRTALRRLAEDAFDGALAPMMSFLVREERLSDEDRATLRRMLDEDEDEASGRGSAT